MTGSEHVENYISVYCGLFLWSVSVKLPIWQQHRWTIQVLLASILLSTSMYQEHSSSAAFFCYVFSSNVFCCCGERREHVEENLERWKFGLDRRGMKVSRSKTDYM
ncbi:hypothetical protein GOODEAATRI_010098 [Goodea atripinnis]|uniref:Uncharacterized protein n=1 Tax=Goodea atripinnis TaxID=208336 RepID=A0ABV0NJ12_9TELE